MPLGGPVRGRIYAADIGFGEKYWLVVSNNGRNQRLEQCLAIRFTTSPKPQLATIIEMSAQDPLVGRVLCDDITEVYRHEIKRDVGAVTLSTMMRVDAGLRAALAL